jgi:hypothetical protein
MYVRKVLYQVERCDNDDDVKKDGQGYAWGRQGLGNKYMNYLTANNDSVAALSALKVVERARKYGNHWQDFGRARRPVCSICAQTLHCVLMFDIAST